MTKVQIPDYIANNAELLDHYMGLMECCWWMEQDPTAVNSAYQRYMAELEMDEVQHRNRMPGPDDLFPSIDEYLEAADAIDAGGTPWYGEVLP